VAQVSTGVWKFRSSDLDLSVENPVIDLDDRIFQIWGCGRVSMRRANLGGGGVKFALKDW
jgi:hypothetical protein